MSNYTKTTNFATKDSLPSGNPAKIVKGTEINTEFDNIAVASATKLDSSTVSTFGATLIDDANASAARTTLGLGTAATTASTNYATAAQGTTADAALPKTGGAMTGAITTNSTFDGRDVATDGTKLDGIEASADVTDTTNVTAAGALMDSEVTNLAQVKAFDSTDYATAAQGVLAAAALPKSGGAMTGAITTNSTFDGRDVATDGTKLDGIEASADVTDTTNVVASLTAGSNITIAADGTISSTASGGGNETLAQTLVLGNTTGGTDLSVSSGDNIVMAASSTVDGRDVSVDGTKLDGIETSADVTDTTNVVASLTAGSNITIAADGTIASTASGGIAGVTAGDGLSGGGTTGTVTVDVDNTVIRTTGAQTKSGQMNFSDVVRVNNTNAVLRLTAGTSNPATIQFGDSGDFDIGKIAYNNSDNSMAFYTNTAEHIRINAGGDLLIGKTANNVSTDGIELHDGGGIYNSFITNGYTDGIEIRNRYSTGSLLDVSANGTQSRLKATNSSNSTGQSLSINGGASGTYATFTNQQRLGIGITAPTQALHVVGDIVATGNITANFSDERLKDFKGTIPNALDKVAQLNGYYYTPNETAQSLGVDNNGLEVGISAQEVEAVLPEIVAKSVIGKDYKTVMYDRLTPLLIEAVKELTQKVEKLELKLSEMEK